MTALLLAVDSNTGLGSKPDIYPLSSKLKYYDEMRHSICVLRETVQRMTGTGVMIFNILKIPRTEEVNHLGKCIYLTRLNWYNLAERNT
jgi:hypothetical protein